MKASEHARVWGNTAEFLFETAQQTKSTEAKVDCALLAMFCQSMSDEYESIAKEQEAEDED